MKEEQFFEVFSNIDSQFIEETKISIPRKRKRRILWRIITGLIALVLVILAIHPLLKKQNPYYAIRQLDGEYYMVSKMNTQEDPLSDPNQVPTIYFDSIEEMYESFIHCNFSKQDLQMLTDALQTQEKIAIPDLDALSQPIIPNDFMWDGNVIWFGDSYYYFSLAHVPYHGCYLCYGNVPHFMAITNQDYNNYLEKHLHDFSGYEILSQEKAEDENTTIYECRASDGSETTFLIYTITDGDKEIHIRETLTANNNTIQMYMRDGALYGYFEMTYRGTRPSLEWLCSFGLAQYEIQD